MIDSILKNISPDLIKGLTQSHGLDANKAKDTLNVTKDSLVGSLTKEASTGNFNAILGLLNSGGNASSNPLFQSLTGSMASSYISKLGIPADKANMISSFILPKIISAISGSKSGDFSQADLIKMLGQGGASSLGDKASSILKGGLGNLFK
ncbi:DUF937 domain-containing protein [Cecembia sp.]|uniref:DUF937 domain-containing protein n=1 Tax=Cecembia sp. TaxID=1898110 RepID=UPI0025B7DBE6|nr:DUF937 domain-containing protein [Cecembia sp.]